MNPIIRNWLCPVLGLTSLAFYASMGSMWWTSFWVVYTFLVWPPRPPKPAWHLPLFRFHVGRVHQRARGICVIFAFAPWPFEEQQPGEDFRCLLSIGLYVSLSRRQISLAVYSDDPGDRPAAPVRKSSRVLMYPETAYAVTPGSWAA